MKFLVIGGTGKSGQAVTAYLTSKGQECRVYTRSAEKAARLNQVGISISATGAGKVEGTFPVKAFTDLGEAVKGVDVIILQIWSNYRREICEALRPHLERGQSILIFNSNWGALQFKKILGDDIAAKELIVADTSNQLFLSASTELGKVLCNIKEQVSVAATDPSKTVPFIQSLASVFPHFVPAGSFYETALSTANPIVHLPICLLNAVRTENEEPFRFYREGLSRGSVNLILALDRERLALAKALGVEVPDILGIVNNNWEIKHDNMFDALHLNNTGYDRTRGPSSFEFKFFAEDIPYGLGPICKISRLFGLPTPIADSLMQTFSVVIGKNYLEEGIPFTKEDFGIA